ncbi:ThiF family adenylyltransferase [Agitococcus lubricus]|uniref:Molybdopterin/thiamine biosynthesis adenylyltransferase n=1 Tax=Agitococcus lubricus TaxID=1077255 RepID=A0A2T5ISI9_9GAMM|nr:ThiF family adenylyltransferase [Agitococcus lubricus]PTQ86789.1 molybdopterin/thiamine biosynthesis adenylyltransferase [Agitococcus lubricus]
MSIEAEISVSKYLYSLCLEFRFSRAPKPIRFGSSQTTDNISSWHGTLKVGHDPLTVLLQIEDWDFITLPSLYIKMPLPLHWQKILPIAHLGPMPKLWHDHAYLPLCYSLNDAYDLTRHNPVHIVEWVLFTKAKSVLQALFNDERFRREELLREIKPFWEGLFYYQFLKPLDEVLTKKYIKHNIFYKDQLVFETSLDICSPSKKLPKHKLKWTNLFNEPQEHIEFPTRVLLISIQKETKIPSFKSLLEELQRDNIFGIRLSIFARWLQRWDSDIHQLFASDLLECWESKTPSVLGCLIVQGQPLAFSISLRSLILSNVTISRLKKELFGKTAISYLDLAYFFLHPSINLSPEFVYRRNLKNMNQPNLEGKKVALIGCGAIGGYLGLSLARLGAGALGGQLSLIDPDTMGEHNLGRHALGMSTLGHNKAKALEEEIHHQLPALNITHFSQSVLESVVLEEIRSYDLIIDATAKMTVSEALNEQYHSWSLTTNPTLLHVWIRANGECVQSLLVEPNSPYACRSCLQRAGHPMNNEYDAMRGHQAIAAFLACSDYTPYAVSAGMSAAALATDIVLDWLSNQSTPRYRTRYSERWQGEKLPSMDILKSQTCHVCSTNAT